MKKETPQSRYDKANMSVVKAKLKNEFVDEFKKACEKLGVTQSSVIRQAMIETIEKSKKYTK